MVPTNKKLFIPLSSLRALVCFEPKKLTSSFLLLALAFLMITSVLIASFSSINPQKAEAINTSSTINFQARILTPAGSLVPDGYYNIRFKIYDGGTQGGPAGTGQANAGSQLWTEQYYDSNGVTAGNDNRLRVVNGYVSVNLGSQTAFSGINWDQELWLTMDVGGTTQTATPTYDGEMLSSVPAANSRLKLTGVPYAFRAGQLAQTTGTNVSTLSFAAQTAANAILLPDAGGTVCLQSATACGFAAATGATGYIQNGTSLQTTANFNIQSAANTSVGGVIQGATSQSADLLQLKDSTGAILTAFDSAGKLVFGPSGSQDTNLYRSTANTLRTDDSLIVTGNITGNGNALFQNTTNSTTALRVQNANGATLLTADTTAQKLTVNTGQFVTQSTFTNLVTNPSIETNLTGWTWDPVVGSPFVFAQTSAWSSSGTQAGHYQVNAAGYGDVVTPTGTSGYPVTAGTVYTGQTVINVVQAHSSGVQLQINWYNSGGALISSSINTTQTGTGVKNTSITATAPGGATYASFSLGVLTPGSNATVQFYWDAVQLVAHDSTLVYFDGSIDGAFWNGTAHGSTSTRSSLLAGTSIFKNTSNSTGAFQIQNAAGTNLINVDTTSSTIGIASSSAAATVNIGNITGASAINLKVGTGNFNLDGVAASTYDLGAATVAGTIAIGGSAQTGKITLGRSTATNIIEIGSSVAASNTQTINLGTSSTASSTTNVNIGSSIAGTTAITGTTTVTGRTSGALTALTVNNSTSTGSIFIAQDNGTPVMTIADGGATTFRNSTDSDSAYLFQNSSGDRVLTVGTTAYSPSLTNLILNPSFETGHTGWSGKNGAGNTSGSTSGSATAYMGTAHGTINATATGHGKSYAITLSPLTQYTFSAYVRLGSGTMSTLVMGRQDQSGTDMDCATSPTIGTSWTRVSCTFTTGGTISSSNVYVKQSDGTTRTIYLDAVQLVTGGSPTSFNNGEIAINTTISRRLVVAGYTSGTGQIFEVQDQTGSQVFGVDTDTNTAIIAGTAAINGGNITTDDTTFNLLNSTATTIHFGGGATTALNIGPTGATGTSINLAGGSGATGCTVDGATGNLTCSGNVSTNATSGTQGWWSRSGTTLQPATSGDNISTTGSGTITSADDLAVNGDAITTDDTTFNLLNATATTINAFGAASAINLGAAGATITNPGSLNIRATGTNTLDLDTTSAGTIGLGDTNATTIGIGNTTAATQTTIQGGTGTSAINIQAGSAGDINIGTVNNNDVNINTAAVAGLTTIGGTATTGQITLGQSTATNTVSVGSANPGASATQTVNIGNGSLVGTSTAIAVNILSGAAGSSGTGTLLIGNNDRVTQIDIGNVAADAARTLNFGTGSNIVGKDTINIGTGNTTVAAGKEIHIGDGTPSGSGTNVITIGSTANASTTTIQGGTGGTAINIQAAASGTINMGTVNNNIVAINTAAVAGTTTIGGTTTTGTITLGRSTETNIVSIGTAAAAMSASQTQTVNIGNGILSNASSSIAVNILSGSAGTNGTASLLMGNNDRVTQIDIGNVAADAARTLNFGTGNNIAAVDTLNIGTGNTTVANGKTINIGTGTPTGSGTNTITIGSLANGSQTTIQGGTGTGGITLSAAGSASTGIMLKNSTNSTAAFQIQNISSQSLFVADTTNQRIAVGPAAVPANGVLTVGINTTTASGGIFFGTDTNLYRYGNNTLASDNHIASTAGSFYTTAAGAGLIFGASNLSGLVNAGAGGTGDVHLYNGSASPIASFSQTGTTIFRNSTNSTVAFQIQSATGTDTMFIADTTAGNKIKIGNSTGTGTSTTVFQLDGATSAPFGTGQTAYLGSMYYDTTQGKLQCYENRNGTAAWGACGSAPNNIITLTPEYTGAVLNGTGVGTMTADFCSNESTVLVVGTLCAIHETRNFYKWTSPQGTNQTYSIYVNYKLPTTFSAFNDANTIKLTALSDNTTNANATLQVFRKNVSGNVITSCGSATTINSSSNTWQQTSFGGNETTCGFVGGDYVIFKIDVTARSSANIYVENLDFIYTNT